MIILKQGKVRRNPAGRHQCPKCGTLFVLTQADVESPAVHMPSSDPGSDRFIDCPGGCNGWVLLNGIGKEEPPAP